MSSWILQDFDVGDISCQLIEFSVAGNVYVMIFNRVDATRTQDVIDEKAEAYVFVAESQKLKRFYDRLVKIYTEALQFSVKNDLGEEGLGYEITTPIRKAD